MHFVCVCFEAKFADLLEQDRCDATAGTRCAELRFIIMLRTILHQQSTFTLLAHVLEQDRLLDVTAVT